MADGVQGGGLEQWIPKKHIDKPPEIKDNGDPAPKAEAVALERMNALVDDVTTTTLNELRELRDEIDNLMRVIQARNNTIQGAFAEHVRFSADTINCKTIVKETLQRINKDFANGMAPIAKNVTVG